jgi:hypothetical protein
LNANAPAAPEIEVPRVPGAAPVSPREELLNRFRAVRPVLPPLLVEVPQLPPVDYDAEERVHMSDADDEDDAWGHDEEPEVVVAPAVPVVPVAEVPVPVVAEPVGNVELQRRVLNVLDDVAEFIGVYVNARITPPLLEAMNAGYERLSEELRGFRARLQEIPAMEALLARVRRAMTELLQATVHIRARAPVPHAAPVAVRPRSRSPVGRNARNRSYDSLSRLESDIDFQLGRMGDDVLVNVRQGTVLMFDQLRTLNDVTMPQVKEAIHQCQLSLREYTSASNYNRDIAAEAQMRCQFATRWISELLLRCREKKLHLDKNLKHKEITFKPFRPGQDVSVYEFFTAFETWAGDYLAEDAMADQLYNKYIDPSITESYAEMVTLKDNYYGMKQWLIRRYGSVVPMAHGYVKAIGRLTVPKAGDIAANIAHMRAIHRMLTNLACLEIEKGTPVPRLEEHLGSNAFLSALVEVIPASVRKEISKDLVRQGLEDPYTLEGREHLTTIINHVRTAYRELEWEQAATQNAKPAAAAPSYNTKKQNQQPAAHVAGTGSGGQPPLTGGNAAPLGAPHLLQQQQYAPQPFVPQPGPPQPVSAPVLYQQQPFIAHPPAMFNPNQGYQFSQPPPQYQQQQYNQVPYSRWGCPLRGHQGHDIQACSEFFSMQSNNRRVQSKYNCCYSCLAKSRKCKGGCCRIEEVPAELICADCATNMKSGSPPCLLMCGLGHTRPSQEDLRKSLEAWIPGLNLRSLGNQLNVGLTWVDVETTATPLMAHVTRTSKPSPQPLSVVYDTATGQARPISQKDNIIRTSSEVAYYAMQTIRIKDQDVLVFFDSGSNGHLIEGELAEELQLEVVTDEMVPIGGLGGKTVWSDYGLYTVTLGPDTNGDLHELDIQGIRAITNKIPGVQLDALWSEAKLVVQDTRPMPVKIGGTRVNMLVGIKSTRLGPKLVHVLPNGLGIYESVIRDIYHSNICFGGPHEVFTKAYRDAGRVVNNVEILFTEMAQAYMNAPRTFVTAHVEDHGPMRSRALEFELEVEMEQAVMCRMSKDKGYFADIAEDVLCTPGEVECECLHVLETDCLPSRECLKAKVPLQKLKGLQDEVDIPEIVEYRCETCSNCPVCKLSARAKTKSLQEEFEQAVILKSVQVDVENGVTYVDLPFVKDPVYSLMKRHGGSDNYYQANRMYISQCRKQEDVKEQIRKAHGELVEKGFMVPLDSLPADVQESIWSAEFRHFYPWKSVMKVESISTPVRLVVDPSISGLNELLAKGVNMLTRIPELLIDLRCHKFAWGTDVSKLYNMLVLNQSSLPYSLFLFHESLDPSVPPTTFVMTRAWYGVASTGNQAGVALEFLAKLYESELPAAVRPLTKSRYVDDILSGADSEEERELQIVQTQDCLKRGGFTMKFVAKSGEPPPAKASSGRSIGCLGLDWATEADTFSLAYDVSFFLKQPKSKVQLPVVDLGDQVNLAKALAGDLVTRAGILSRVAEFYDPCGLFECVKIQLKLALQGMNGLEWNAPVPPEYHADWIKLFELMKEIKKIEIPRCIVPEDHVGEIKLRLIVVADAGLRACGAAVYAGTQRTDGSFSCSLLIAKSRMAHHTVPRNELEGVVLAGETALVAQQALGDMHQETRVFTDSRIVVCWVLNKSRRLRMWAFNRVQAIHNMLRKSDAGEDTIPLFHISGTDNLADLLTKLRTVSVSDVDSSSVWFNGLPWMSTDTASLPSEQFVTVPAESAEQYNKELFQEIEFNVVEWTREGRSLLQEFDAKATVPSPVDCHVSFPVLLSSDWLMSSVGFMRLGWKRALKVIETVLRACDIMRHGVHEVHRRDTPGCTYCRPGGRTLEQRAMLLVERSASRQAEKNLTKKCMAEKYHLSPVCGTASRVWPRRALWR